MSIIGWDISTSAIGVCVRKDTGETLGFTVIFPIGETHAQKHISAARQIDDFMTHEALRNDPDGGPITHFVEDCLGGFTGGLTTKQTLMKLASMNAVVSFVLARYGHVVHIAPVTTKRITGLVVPKGGNKKLEVIKLARSREPTFPYAETAAGNWVKGTDDMADAWLLAEAGLKIASGEAAIGQPKKTASGKGKTGRAKGGGPKEGGVRVPVSRKARKRRVLERVPGQSPPVGEP